MYEVIDKVLIPNWAISIYQACRNLNQDEIYLSGELFYKPFFNEHFGPIINQIEIEVLVTENYRTVVSSLKEKFPQYRWKISKIPKSRLEEHLQRRPFKFMSGAIKMEKHQNSYVFAYEETYEHLIQGKVEPTPYYSNSFKDDLLYILSMYPGLSSEFFQIENNIKISTVEEIEEEIEANETGGRICRYDLTAKEIEIAEKIKDWHKGQIKEKQLVPIPLRGKEPTGDPWESSDEEFREWMLHQTYLKYNSRQKDTYLEYVLNLQKSGEQKPTHEGWGIFQHSIMSSLQLVANPFPPRIRKCMRVAMVWHDVGKLKNVWTPGAHGSIGSKIWRKPEWLDEEDEKLVKFLIKTHDYYGLLDRWIQNQDYKGGLSPKKIRDTVDSFGGEPLFILQLMKHIYEADIKSVSRLRRFLPLTPLLDEMILCEWPNTVD